MALQKNPEGVYEADIKDRVVGRLHLSLRTKNGREAGRRYAAVETAVRQNHPIVALLRRRKINLHEVTVCYEQGRPFDTLLHDQQWPTLAEAVTDYLRWVEDHPTRSDKTSRNAESQLNQAVAYFGGDLRLDAIPVEGDEKLGTKGTQDWHRALKDGGRIAATVAGHVQRLATLFRWVQRREDTRALKEKRTPRVLHVPIDWEMVPRGQSHRVRFLSPGEAARLMAAVPSRLRFHVAAGLLAGLRIDEAMFLTRHDFDRDLGWLYVQRKPAPWLKRGEWSPKARSAREVPLDTQLAPLLDGHLARFAGPRWLLPSAELAERPMTAHTLAHHFTTVVADAGLVPGRTDPEGVTFHTLRHTFASWLVMEGVDLLTVARLLGHTTTKQVEQTYAHLSPEHRAQAVARLGNRFTLVLPDAAPAVPVVADSADPATQRSQTKTQRIAL